MSDATTDPKARLSHDEILEAGLDDWRKVLNRLRARFRTGDFATGVALVDRIGAAADEADHHPDVSLTYPEVIVTLQQPRRRRHHQPRRRPRPADQRLRGRARRERRHLRAHRARARARHGRARAARRLLRRAPRRRGRGRRARRPERSGAGAVVPEGRARRVRPCPPQDPEQRWHFDVWVPHDEGERRLAGRPRRRWPAGERRRGAVVLGGRGRRRQPLLHLHAARPRVTGPPPRSAPRHMARLPFQILGRLSHLLDAGPPRRRRLSHAHRDSCTHATRELRPVGQRTRVTPRRPPGRGAFLWAHRRTPHTQERRT